MELCVIKKKMTVGPKKGQTLYGLTRVSSPTIHSSVIVDDVKQASTFSHADAVQIIKEFGLTVSRLISQGYIIDMGDLGTIRPTLSAKSVDSEKKCTAETIRSRGILYKSRGDFAEDIKGISLTITNLSSGSASADDDDTGDDNQNNGDGNGSSGDSGNSGTTPGGGTSGGGGDLEG